MVELKELYPGAKVKIVDKWCAKCYASTGMNIWLGQTMTVDYIGATWGGTPCAFMLEDVGHGSIIQGNRWYWFPAAIDYILDEDFPDVDDLI